MLPWSALVDRAELPACHERDERLGRRVEAAPGRAAAPCVAEPAPAAPATAPAAAPAAAAAAASATTAAPAATAAAIGRIAGSTNSEWISTRG